MQTTSAAGNCALHAKARAKVLLSTNDGSRFSQMQFCNGLLLNRDSRRGVVKTVNPKQKPIAFRSPWGPHDNFTGGLVWSGASRFTCRRSMARFIINSLQRHLMAVKQPDFKHQGGAKCPPQVCVPGFRIRTSKCSRSVHQQTRGWRCYYAKHRSKESNMV